MNNSKRNRIKAIILDFDQTIADLKVNWALVRSKMTDFCAKSGIEADFSYPKPIYEVARAVSKNKRFYDNLSAIVSEEELKSAERAKLIPGANAFLKFLQVNNIPFAILSNNNSQCIEKIFKKFKLPSPKMIIGSNNVKRLKPHPEGFNKIFNKMKIKKTQCLLIGDSNAELCLGKLTGVKTFIIPGGKMKNFDQLKNILI